MFDKLEISIDMYKNRLDAKCMAGLFTLCMALAPLGNY